MEWLADRFFFEDGAWIDAASRERVRIRFEATSALDAFDWDEQCGRLANARHPLLNALLDYGEAPGGRRFEAYESGSAVPDAGETAEHLLLHAVQFLRTSGVTMPPARAPYAMRAVVHGPRLGTRPLGITLQPRRALSIVRETLESPAAAPVVLTVVGPCASGLRTARLFVARDARRLGFIPVSSSLFTDSRSATLLPPERHLCVLDDEDEAGRRDFAGALVKLAAASARRHVVVKFRRTRGTRGAIELDPLPVRALVGMVFTGDSHTTERELFDAARLADGRPGAFLAQLHAPIAPTRTMFVVHETPQEYVVEPVVTSDAPAAQPGRTVTAALRAGERAAALAARGRYAAAERALRRGARVLAGRERVEEAADCLVRAGRLALDRGRAADAATLFEEAQRTSGSGAAALRAATGLGEAWMEDGRLIEAEAVLRGAFTAAEAMGDRDAAMPALAGLVTCLHRHGRPADAIAVATAAMTEERAAPASLLAALARCHAAVGRSSAGVDLARRAQRAAAVEDPRAVVAAEIAVADTLGAVGDVAGMRSALDRASAIARTAHLPRALAEIEAASRTVAPPVDIHRETAEALEILLQVSQQASDEVEALSAVCGATLRRVRGASVMVIDAPDRRVLACDGRSWVGHSTAVSQALATGGAAATDAGIEPREAAEAIRYGADIIGAVAVRWTAGTAVDALGAAAVIHAAAVAAAAPLRSVLDRVPAPPPSGAWGDLLGDSPAATELRAAVARAARAPFPVLIEGESGCGKELVARAIHRLGPRRERRFCAINCAALTDDLVEAELFGHSRGAFTGAATERAGLFEEADGGTLFLDEVGELSARAQAKLLRVLQEGEVRRVGENFPRRVDPRIVAATNRRLEDEVAGGHFRGDLRFRLDVIRIVVPPLRERPGDIPVLATHFWNSASKSVGTQATLTSDTLATLARYDWPGNVRELQNVVAWIAVHSPRRGRIGPGALPAHVAQSSIAASCTFEAARDEFERRFIRAALANANGHRARAADAMGVSRQGLAKMMRRLGLSGA